MPPGGPGMMAPGGPVAAFKVNYFTHAIAVDFRGGERLRGRKGNSLGLAAPGEILLLDSDGNLMVRDEFDDKPTYEQLTKNDAPEGADEGTQPKGVRGGGGGGKAGPMDNLFNHDQPPKRRPPTRR
jgi:hypothetical protein